ncbi:mismatch repair endonuclease PMS2 [Pelomyxa schiedti]|nr:mismatch repair endonuclease PMS2 [Pelomyxa schiedti]
MIHPIELRSVHRICSEQVVVSISSAVKELVENSLDAGATCVEVTLRDCGLKSIEVSDNGSGLSPSNFETVALAHYTSKINSFDDLPRVQSFGFRGEALSALASLGTLTITTRTAECEVATLLRFDNMGALTSQQPAARMVGTTVVVSNIFAGIPVRVKEMESHPKMKRKELIKVLEVMYAYAIISTGVRLRLTHMGDRHKGDLFHTEGNPTIRENLISLFGVDFTRSLVDITLETEHFKLTGLMSKAMNTASRTSADKQYIFINKRPVDLPHLNKAINQLFHTTCKNRFPAFVLSFVVPEGTSDINVTPDKRTVMLHFEDEITTKLMESLQSGIWSPNKLDFQLEAATTYALPVVTPTPTLIGEQSSSTACSQILPKTKDSSESPLAIKLPSRPSSPITKPPSRSSSPATALHGTACTTLSPDDPLSPSHMIEHLIKSVLSPCTSPDSSPPSSPLCSVAPGFGSSDESSNNDSDAGGLTPKQPSAKAPNPKRRRVHSTLSVQCTQSTASIDENDCVVLSDSEVGTLQWAPEEPRRVAVQLDIDMMELCVQEIPLGEKPCSTTASCGDPKTPGSKGDLLSDSAKGSSLKFSRRFGADSNSACEDELQRVFTKDSFTKMEIIGQFNKGFVICRLEDDIFIVDQHASHEIWNFEMLQKSTEIKTQGLIIPLPLQLSCEDEILVMEYPEVFKKNGFNLLINPEEVPGRRVQIKSQPYSRSTTFGAQDAYELVALLRASGGTPAVVKGLRLSGIVRMFASRACRKSIMIGDALSHIQMVKLIQGLAELEKPWNCPHGRPTMRHLFNFNMHKERVNAQPQYQILCIKWPHPTSD